MTGSEDREEPILNEYFENFAGPLGHVILEFNYLEVDLGRMIARLLRQDDVTAGAFAAHVPFIAKLLLVQTLVDLKVADADLKLQFSALIKRATIINGKRNRYVHAEYMPLVDPQDRLTKMLHRRLKDAGKAIDADKGEDLSKLLQPVSERDLKILASEIHSLSYEVRALAERYVDFFPS